jgi:formamidopyrimidine-DNA glycosylase
MPELPEVETIRHDLEREITGKKIKSVEITGARTSRRAEAAVLSSRLEGRTVKAVRRRGKYLLIVLDSGEWLVIHLRMSGQLLKATAKQPRPKHTHATLVLASGVEIRFVDPRTFGELFVVHPDNIAEEAPDLADLGWDPVEEPLPWVELGRMLVRRHQQLKNLLTDQKVIAGIGAIYSDEILHAAGLRPDHLSDAVTTQEIRRLHRSILEILFAAIGARGSSLADEQYVDLNGKMGSYQTQHQVYARDGQACLRCRGTIVKEKWAGRSTYFCPSCQV